MAAQQILSSAVNSTVDTAEALFTAGKAYIVAQDGTEQPQIPFKVVVWGENDLGIGIVNQIIPAFGSLKLECSALASIYFTATGREI